MSDSGQSSGAVVSTTLTVNAPSALPPKRFLTSHMTGVIWSSRKKLGTDGKHWMNRFWSTTSDVMIG